MNINLPSFFGFCIALIIVLVLFLLLRAVGIVG